MISPELIEQRKFELDDFYAEAISVLVEFVGQMGINPAPQVLIHAADYLPLLSTALKNVELDGDDEKIWLHARVAYFVGEYFAQRYQGSWYVNEDEGSVFYGRYVVGRFSAWNDMALMVDPFEVGRSYIGSPVPRNLQALVDSVDAELKDRSTRGESHRAP